MTVGRHDRAGLSLDQGRSRRLGAALEGVGHGFRAAQLGPTTHSNGSGVGAQHDVGIKQRKKCLDIAAARGGKEGIHHAPLPSKIDLVHLRALHAPPRAARGLPRGDG